MTNARIWSAFLVLALLVLVSCKKELSFEEGVPQPPPNTAEGTLNGAPGSCANFEVLGAYGQGLAFDTSNKVNVELNISTAGSWFVFTDTVNGMWFSGTGSVAVAGITLASLKASGTPLNPGTFTFNANFKGSRCSFVVTVYPTATATTGDYFPTTAGSWWTYQSSDPAAAPDDTLYQLSTGITATVPGLNSFSLFTNEVPGFKDSSFYRKNSGDYIQFGDLDVSGLADLPVVAEWIFLKDNVAKGAQWLSSEQNATSGGVPLKMRLQNEIVAKGVNVVLDNKVYANVIKVRTRQQVQLLPPTWQDAVEFESWFAKGIGLINVAVESPIYGYKVVKYSVK